MDKEKSGIVYIYINGYNFVKLCKIAKNMIDKNLEYDMSKYVYIDKIKKSIVIKTIFNIINTTYFLKNLLM